MDIFKKCYEFTRADEAKAVAALREGGVKMIEQEELAFI